MKKFLVSIVCFLMIMSVTTAFAQKDFRVYGYLSLYYENVGTLSNAPSGTKSDPGEFDYANLNIMMESNITDKVRAYINLRGTGDIEVRNYWGEYIFSDKLKLRAGKIYRPFGQFNEKLDAVPTYLGMEPPELFDKDHLMLPRVGKMMLHGGTMVGNNFLRYAYMLDSDENMLSAGNDEITLSHSWDLRMSMLNDKLEIGHSGFVANEQNGPATGLGDGSPRTGVLPWMASDKYNVLGAYMTAKLGKLTVKGAYWVANHDAVRNADLVATLYQSTSLNDMQVDNFYGANYAGAGAAGDVISAADFKVSTYYIRLGYTIPKGKLPFELTPYAFLDWYSNPETVASKTWGGDNEAGVADDGKFSKPTFGFAIRPNPFMALKIDGSAHMYKHNGEDVNYKEIRMDLSFIF